MAAAKKPKDMTKTELKVLALTLLEEVEVKVKAASSSPEGSVPPWVDAQLKLATAYLAAAGVA